MNKTHPKPNIPTLISTKTKQPFNFKDFILIESYHILKRKKVEKMGIEETLKTEHGSRDTPLWSTLLQWGIIGIVIVVGIATFRKKK